MTPLSPLSVYSIDALALVLEILQPFCKKMLVVGASDVAFLQSALHFETESSEGIVVSSKLFDLFLIALRAYH